VPPEDAPPRLDVATSKEVLLARTMVELADTLVDNYDVVDLFILLAHRCVEVLEVDAAGIMLAGPAGDLRVMASSSEAMRLLELFEVQSEEGPCLDCYRSATEIVNSDLTDADSPWPRFAAEAVTAGFRSVHALPMRLRGTTLGALNLLQVNSHPLSESDVVYAQALADIATIGVLQHSAALEAQRVNEQLQNALTSRVAIEQAKGMVAEAANLAMAEAFGVLRTYARNRNRRLVDLAHDVVDGTVSTVVLISG
jgi:GAF domain-containing protein